MGSKECEVVVQAENWFSWVSGGDTKRCRMISDEMCVICDSRVEEDMAHFRVGCGDLRKISWCCWMMCAELWGLESGWMNFG